MIWGIYLAAGLSRRMGRPKLCLPIEGRPLGSFALEAALASRLDGVAVVTRARDPLRWISPVLKSGAPRRGWVHSPSEAACSGMAESLKCGVRAARRAGARAVLVLLADQPFVTAPMIDRMLALYREERPAWIAARHDRVLRPPVLFDSRMFPELLRLYGDAGARRIIHGHSRERGRAFEWHNGRWYADVDTPADYAALSGTRSFQPILHEETSGWKTTALSPQTFL